MNCGHFVVLASRACLLGSSSRSNGGGVMVHCAVRLFHDTPAHTLSPSKKVAKCLIISEALLLDIPIAPAPTKPLPKWQRAAQEYERGGLYAVAEASHRQAKHDHR